MSGASDNPGRSLLVLQKRKTSGFSLLETLLGVALSSALIIAIVQLLTVSISAYRNQLSRGQLTESSRYARAALSEHITQAGFVPEPWLSVQALPALTDEALEGAPLPGDQLGVQRWTRQNCYGNENPISDSKGRAAFYLMRVRFRVSGSGNFAMTCRYGANPSELKTQINNFGLLEGVESMQVLYAEDRNGDAIADTWVKAGQWLEEGNIKAVKVALLMTTQLPMGEPATAPYTLLDETLNRPADGYLRRVNLLTAAIRGRIR